LKSFRDANIDYPPYLEGAAKSASLRDLGPLVMRLDRGKEPPGRVEPETQFAKV
jgi:hypothetical protein